MGHRVGWQGILQISTDGGSTFETLDNCADVTLNQTMGEGQATTRANAGYEAMVATLMAIAPEWSMVWDTDDDEFNTIRSAFYNRTPITLRLLDRPNGDGVECTVQIFNFTRNEPLDAPMMVDVATKVTRSDNPPRRVEDGTVVSSSSSGV